MRYHHRTVTAEYIVSFFNSGTSQNSVMTRNGGELVMEEITTAYISLSRAKSRRAVLRQGEIMADCIVRARHTKRAVKTILGVGSLTKSPLCYSYPWIICFCIWKLLFWGGADK